MMCGRLASMVVTTCMVGVLCTASTVGAATKYCRFRHGGLTAYGIVEGSQVRRLSGDIFGDWAKTDEVFSLSEIELLVPTEPTQVLAMAGNYRSHLGGESITTTITSVTTVVTDQKSGATTSETETETETRQSGTVPVKFQTPQPFFKSRSCLVPHGAEIVLPKGSEPVHYEAELVVVIGTTAKNVSQAEALEYVFGATCGNDVSARDWQQNDVQWWRAKGSDTFGPCGPFIVTGLNYDDLPMQLRLNGEVRQNERTSQMIHDVSTTVSVISHHVTLQPGDLIFTGTTGQTSEMKPGDVVEVEIEGIGVLRNEVVGEE